MTTAVQMSPVSFPANPLEPVCLSEVLSALSFALDLTENAEPGHALRSCLLGMRLAATIGLQQTECSSLFYALQLKDVGCSSNAARMTAIVGGDDRVLKTAAKLQDWTRPHRPSPRVVRVLWSQVLPGAPIWKRLSRIVTVARTQHANNAVMISMRCERGANIVRRLDLGENVAEAVRHLDEHWDGSGYPDGLRASAIPLLARISSLAQNLDIFACADGQRAALNLVRSRRGTWFDPELVWAAESLAVEGKLWSHCGRNDDVENTRSAVLDLDPGLSLHLTAERLDRICEAFAEVIDAKSPFTFRHSVGVAEIAFAIAEELGLDRDACRNLRRAGLLHDLGKLSVPNTILDKKGKLTEAEWTVVREHPRLSGSILRRVPALAQLGKLAEEHHERLDGSGYPKRMIARDLSIESRILALADTYAAMVEERPYREPMSREDALRQLLPAVGKRLDPGCFEALRYVSQDWPTGLPPTRDAIPTLTAERELQWV